MRPYFIEYRFLDLGGGRMFAGHQIEGIPMKNAARRLFALIRQFFADDSWKVAPRRHNATIWRIAPPGEKPVDHTGGGDDIDFIRIYPAKRRR